MRDVGSTLNYAVVKTPAPHEKDQRPYLHTSGIDWGRRLVIVYRRKDQLVVCRAGHKSWCGIGWSEYTGALYMRLRLRKGTATVLESIDDPGKKWRAARAQLIANAKEGRP